MKNHYADFHISSYPFDIEVLHEIAVFEVDRIFYEGEQKTIENFIKHCKSFSGGAHGWGKDDLTILYQCRLPCSIELTIEVAREWPDRDIFDPKNGDDDLWLKHTIKKPEIKSILSRLNTNTLF